jgi:hypothetical protein
MDRGGAGDWAAERELGRGLWSQGKCSRKAGGASVRPELVRKGTESGAGVCGNKSRAGPGLQSMDRGRAGVWETKQEVGLVNRYMSTPVITIVAAVCSRREKGGGGGLPQE